MPLILPGNVASATAAVGYNVANSCRFNKADDASHSKSSFDTGSNLKWTASCWAKVCLKTGDGYRPMISSSTSSSIGTWIYFGTGDEIAVQDYNGGATWNVTTNAKFRDPAAWYNVVVRYDSAQSTNTDRLRVYVNGVLQSLNTANYPDEDEVSHGFGNSALVEVGGDSGPWLQEDYDGYLAEVIFCDNQSLAPTSFGEFDSDSPTIWKPKDVSGLTSVFYLDFEDSDNLGDDESGNSNDFTENNITAIHQSADSPTNNFAVMNPLANLLSNPGLFTEGNLEITSAGAWCSYTSTIGVNKGKWFAEMKLTVHNGNSLVGILSENVLNAGNGTDDYGISANLGINNQYQGIGYFTGNGKRYPGSGGAPAAYGDTYTAGDIIGISMNVDDGELIFYKNGTAQDSGTAIDFTPGDEYWFFALSNYSGTPDTMEVNFGNSISAISSGNADADGYGNFEYAVPSGFFSLCSKNLAEYG